MKLDILKKDLVQAQTDALWSGLQTRNFQKYRMVFEMDPMLSRYGEMIDEERFEGLMKVADGKPNHLTKETLKTWINVMPFV